MTTPVDVANGIKAWILAKINPYILEMSTEEIPLAELGSQNVLVVFPDPDTYREAVMIHLVPGVTQVEPMTMETEAHTQEIDAFIICRKDNQVALTQKVFKYWAAMKQALYEDRSLSALVDQVLITEVEFFPAVEAGVGIVAVKSTMTISYSEDLE